MLYPVLSVSDVILLILPCIGELEFTLLRLLSEEAVFSAV